MKANAKRYVICICVGLLIACTVMLTRNIFEETDTNQILIILNDAFFISGTALTCVGGLVFVSDKGMFHMLSYGVSLFFTVRKRHMERKYKDFYEYKKAKEEEKHGCTHLLLVGLAFIAVSLILLIWIKL